MKRVLKNHISSEWGKKREGSREKDKGKMLPDLG